MVKTINLSRSVYDLCTDYPEIIDILNELGFKDILKPGMMQTAGRIMTIPKGAAMKKISIDDIKKKLEEKAFVIEEDK